MSPFPQDTIVAISTPPGRGGIGIVRLSGADCRTIGAPFLSLKQPLAHAQTRFGYLLDLTGSQPYPVLDEVVVTLYVGPRSYTAEDVLEISSHGSPVILAQIVRQCVAGGARLAEPGEFTQRAFLAGRIDLTQAEAVHDLVESTTLHQARLAASQLGGSLSRQVSPVKSALIHLIATLEAGIDFAEDDIDLLPSEEIARKIRSLRAPLLKLQESFSHGRLVREGVSLVIVGRPNAGKSSLFNALLGRERAIVTSAPGTTRDLITEQISIGGVPVELIDTAGIRSEQSQAQTANDAGIVPALEEAELLGIAKSREALAEAGLTLLVIDASLPLTPEDRMILLHHADRPLLIALNKSDLLTRFGHELEQQQSSAQTDIFPEKPHTRNFPERTFEAQSSSAQRCVIETSTLTGTGVPELRAAIETMLAINPVDQEGAALTSLRQHESTARAVKALNDADRAVQNKSPHEILLLHLQDALNYLDELTGATTGDDILSVIFSSFCIGK